jgi:replicative DNA helicase
MVCEDREFANSAIGLLKPEYFDSASSRILLGIIKDYVIHYSRELNKNNLIILSDEYVAQRGFQSDTNELLKEEVQNIFRTNISSESFIKDKFIDFVKNKAFCQAIYDSVEIVKTGANYEKALQLIDSAVSVGDVGDKGFRYKNLITLPEEYKKYYDVGMLTNTGFMDYDEALGGGMAPGELHVILGAPKMGKCLAVGTKVRMADGSLCSVEDIKSGDKLMGVGGEHRTVRGTTRGFSEMYQISQNKGKPYIVNKDHILSLRNSYTEKVVNISVLEYLASSDNFKHAHKGYKSSVAYPRTKLHIDPYFLGLWLGDGNTNDCRITTADAEIVSYLENYAKQLELEFIATLPKNPIPGNKPCWLCRISTGTRGKLINRPINKLHEDMKSLGVYGNKHIPVQYLRSHRIDRLRLLAGLIDSDGTVDKNGGRGCVIYSSKIESLATEVCELAASLGVRSNLKTRKVKLPNGEDRDYFVVSMAGDFSEVPVLLSRKKSIHKGIRNPLHTGIQVTSIGVGEYAGFELDGDGLFLLEDFTVTHNSTMAVNIGANVLQRGKPVFHITLELKERDVAMKYAMRITGMTRQEILYDNTESYRDRIMAYQQFSSDLYIKYYTMATVNAMNLRSWISSIRAETGKSPGLIIVDYDDLLKPTADAKSMYEDAGGVYADLIALGDYFKAPILTLAQPQRQAWYKYDDPTNPQLVTMQDLAHSAMKAHHCYSISSLNFKKGSEEGVLYVDVSRRGTSYKEIKVKRDFSRAIVKTAV